MSKLQSLPVGTIVFVKNIKSHIRIREFREQGANCNYCIKNHLNKGTCLRIYPSRMKDCLGRYRPDRTSVIFERNTDPILRPCVEVESLEED